MNWTYESTTFDMDYDRLLMPNPEITFLHNGIVFFLVNGREPQFHYGRDWREYVTDKTHIIPKHNRDASTDRNRLCEETTEIIRKLTSKSAQLISIDQDYFDRLCSTWFDCRGLNWSDTTIITKVSNAIKFIHGKDCKVLLYGCFAKMGCPIKAVILE